jgi:hypothetical protein
MTRIPQGDCTTRIHSVVSLHIENKTNFEEKPEEIRNVSLIILINFTENIITRARVYLHKQIQSTIVIDIHRSNSINRECRRRCSDGDIRMRPETPRAENVSE